MDDEHDHMDSACATLQHIENLHNRIRKLQAQRIQAEEQLLHRAGNAWRAREMSSLHFWLVFRRYKRLKIDGRMKRWNAIMPVSWTQMPNLRRWDPNGPAGTWVGPWPIGAADRRPPPDSFVVYVLFDAANEPVYVGSTGDLRARLRVHAKNGIAFITWQAYAAADREAAYRLEEKVLRERLPPLNKRAGR